MSNQLIKETAQGVEKIFPKNYIQNLVDKESGKTLQQILNSFNMLFLNYIGNKADTRKQVPTMLRKQGLWITYVVGKTTVTEWYNSQAIDDTTWGASTYWVQGSNMLVGDVAISANGTWVINGQDTGISPKGDKGETPLIRVKDNLLQVSYDNGTTYNNLTNTPVYTKFRFNSQTNTYQVSYDLGGTWQDISDEKVYHKFRYNNITNTYQESIDFGKTWSNISAEKVYYQFRYNAETNTHQVSTDLGQNWTDVSSNKVYYQFRTNDNRLQVSTDLGTTWESCSEPIAAWFRWADVSGTGNVGKVQISRDNKTWSDLSPTITNNLYIKGYVSTVGDLPTSSAAIGDIYMVGPTYDESDTTHDYPHYRMWVKQSSGWVDNGEFTNAGPVGTNNIIDGAVTLEKIADNAFDNEPTAGSDNLIKSGGVADSEIENLKTLAKEINLSTWVPYLILSSGNFADNAAWEHYFISVKEGSQYIVEYGPDDENNAYFLYAFATSDDYGSTSSIPLVSGTSVGSVGVGLKKVVKIPVGCKYLLINRGLNINPFTVRLYELNGELNERIDNIESRNSYSDINVLHNKSLSYPDGVFSENNSYDVIICRVPEGSYGVSFNANARRYATYMNNPYNEQSTKYQAFDNNYTAGNVCDIPELVLYIAFMVEKSSTLKYYSLKDEKSIYKGLTPNAFKNHLDEINNIPNYDFRNEIIRSVWYRNENNQIYVNDNLRNSIIVKIKEGAKYLRLFIKDYYWANFFSELPTINSASSSFISLYQSPDSGVEIPSTAKYCMISFTPSSVNNDYPLSLIQICEEQQTDIPAPNPTKYEKIMDIDVTEASIQNAFNGGVYPEGIISKLRACSICKKSNNETFLAFGTEYANVICVAIVSDDASVSSSFINWADDGKKVGYPCLIKDNDDILHLFFAEYTSDETSCRTKHYKSVDSGTNWTFVDNIEHTVPNTSLTLMCSSYQGVVISNGKLVIPLYWVGATVPKTAAGICVYDADNSSYVVYSFKDEVNSVNEGTAIEISDNVIMLSLRTQRNICRIAYVIDLNNESPVFIPYTEFNKGKISKKNGETMGYSDGVIVLTKISRGESTGANNRYDPALYTSTDMGKTFEKKLLLFTGATVGETSVINDGDNLITCAAKHFDGYIISKIRRKY